METTPEYSGVQFYIKLRYSIIMCAIDYLDYRIKFPNDTYRYYKRQYCTEICRERETTYWAADALSTLELPFSSCRECVEEPFTAWFYICWLKITLLCLCSL